MVLHTVLVILGDILSQSNLLACQYDMAIDQRAAAHRLDVEIPEIQIAILEFEVFEFIGLGVGLTKLDEFAIEFDVNRLARPIVAILAVVESVTSQGQKQA